MMRYLLFFLLASLVATGCATTTSSPEYALICTSNAVFEQGKNGYDPDLGGYWLFGSGKCTVRLDPLHAATPAALGRISNDLVLSIRTGVGRQLPRMAFLRIATPKHTIVRQSSQALFISEVDNPTHVEERRDTDLVNVTSDGSRIKVVLTAKFLRRYAPFGAAISWFEEEALSQQPAQ
ncbi:MAG: hypothetical protein LBV54_08455 [Puniceicoccales bacterium]|jgi:hypothetical protein|nr:hypothetical protein [Puniceicoccales bacterium]